MSFQSLQTTSRLFYATLIFAVLCVAFLALSPLPQKQIGDMTTEKFYFRVVPADAKVYKPNKVTVVGDDGFVGRANSIVLKSNLVDSRDVFKFVFKRDGFKTKSETFSQSTFEAALAQGAFPPPNEPPIFLEGSSLVTVGKLKILAYPAPSALLVFAALFAGFLLKKQSGLQKYADRIKDLKAQPGQDHLIGTLVSEYVLVKSLGKGGQGAVYKAVPKHLIGTEKEDTSAVAIKLCILDTQDKAQRDEALARFQVETKALRKLKGQPNVVRYIEDGLTEAENPDDRIPYLVLEFIEGETLDELVCKRESEMKTLGEEEVAVSTVKEYFKFEPLKIVDYLGPIAKALQAAHEEKIYHRDLKPLNIKIAKDGRPVLLDFGLAKLEDSTITRTGIFIGTPGYSPAQQIVNTKGVSQEADIFAIGAIIFHMLSGRSFHESEDTMEILQKTLTGQKGDLATKVPELNSELIEVVYRMLALGGEKPYGSISEAFESFESAAQKSAQ